MVVECVAKFRDLEENRLREIGERFEVTPERFASMNSTKYGELVRAVEVTVGRKRRGGKRSE